MLPLYEENEKKMCFYQKRSEHTPPHLHKAIELVYVTKGTLELGIGTELYHMEKGDFAMVFPDLIHHYQVFSGDLCKGYYVLVTPSFVGQYTEQLQNYSPKDPVIKREDVHKDIVYAIEALREMEDEDSNAMQAFVQIIVTRGLQHYQLEKRSAIGNDIVYRTVSYISAHFKEPITLTKMARDLGVNKYSLSRVFSRVFHCNYNQYLNKTRLDYAVALLEYTQKSIIDVSLDAGFESQRTFNRAFQEYYKITPREYRNCSQKRAVE